MNLGEFRKQTEHLSDDTEMIVTDDNYELRGSWTELKGVHLVKVIKKMRNFRDDFDGIHYSSEVYVPNENGTEALKL